jgi:hypothetical protein
MLICYGTLLKPVLGVYGKVASTEVETTNRQAFYCQIRF